MATLNRGVNIANVGDSISRGFQQRENIDNRVVRDRASKLGIDQKQAELDRFGEESNLLSVATAAQEFLNIAPEQRGAFLEQRNQTLINERRDNTDTMQMMQLNPEQQTQAANAAVQIAQQRGLLKQSQQPPKPDTTSLIKNAESIGLTRGTPEFNTFMREQLAKKTGTTINLPSEKGVQQTRSQKQQDLLDKSDVQEFTKLRNESNFSKQILARLNIMKNFDIKTGAFEPFKAKLAGIASGLGFSDLAKNIGDAPKAEALQSLSTQLVNTVLNAAKGPQTDQDAARAFDTIAKLGDTQEAFQFKLKMLSALEQRNVDKFRFINNEKKKGLALNEAFGLWDEENLKNPIISKRNSNSTGLPMFFEDFEKQMRSNPNNKGASKADIVEAWVDFN